MSARRILLLVKIILLLSGLTAASANAQKSLSREAFWPPIESYANMKVWELSIEISFMRGDLEYFKQRSDPQSKKLAIQAQNRLNLLFQLYAERTGRSLESVLEMYGYPRSPKGAIFD